MDYDDEEKDHRGCLRLPVDEVFYLSQEEGNRIFISRKQTYKLERHQLRGLRFLHRQYKMKKPGVIMNDASGFGKKVQTAVFLDALKHTLAEPALILCNEIERDNWKYYFMHFGRKYKEILSLDATLPSADKKIFIRSFDDIEAVVKKTWSIVVVDDPVAIKLFKPLKSLKAAFRIWVVSIELKYNLNTFAAINDWVNPNNTFTIQDYTPKNKSVSEIIEKAVLLDRYFEELVLSRGHEDKKNKTKQSSKIKASAITKNKDPTGAKTKNSRTKTTITKPLKNNEGINKPKAGTSQEASKKLWRGRKASHSSDESWEEPVTAKRKKNIKSTINSDDDDGDDIWQCLDKRLNKNHATSNIIPDGTENNAATKTDISKDINTYHSEGTSKNEDFENNSLSPNNSIEYDLNTIPMEAEESVRNESNEIIVDGNLDNSTICKSIINEKPTNSGKKELTSIIAKIEPNKMANMESANKIETNKSTTSETELPQAETRHSKMDESIIDTKIRDLEEKTFAQFKGSFLDQLLGNNKTSPKSNASSCNLGNTVKQPNELVKNSDDLLNKSPKAISKIVETDKHTSPVKIAHQSPSKGSPQKIDDQIKELEQKTYNKFKGSLLDQLF